MKIRGIYVPLVRRRDFVHASTERHCAVCTTCIRSEAGSLELSRRCLPMELIVHDDCGTHAHFVIALGFALGDRVRRDLKESCVVFPYYRHSVNNHVSCRYCRGYCFLYTGTKESSVFIYEHCTFIILAFFRVPIIPAIKLGGIKGRIIEMACARHYNFCFRAPSRENLSLSVFFTRKNFKGFAANFLFSARPSRTFNAFNSSACDTLAILQLRIRYIRKSIWITQQNNKEGLPCTKDARVTSRIASCARRWRRHGIFADIIGSSTLTEPFSYHQQQHAFIALSVATHTHYSGRGEAAAASALNAPGVLLSANCRKKIALHALAKIRGKSARRAAAAAAVLGRRRVISRTGLSPYRPR